MSVQTRHRVVGTIYLGYPAERDYLVAFPGWRSHKVWFLEARAAADGWNNEVKRGSMIQWASSSRSRS